MFLGCGIAEDGTGFLVTEFMDGGSLDRALWGSGSVSICTSWTQRIQILLDVVDGLAYLHLMHKTVHQDVKSPNILLETVVSNDDAARSDNTVKYRAKLGDFGLSKIFIKGKKRIGTTKVTAKSSKDAIGAANWTSMKQSGYGSVRTRLFTLSCFKLRQKNITRRIAHSYDKKYCSNTNSIINENLTRASRSNTGTWEHLDGWHRR